MLFRRAGGLARFRALSALPDPPVVIALSRRRSDCHLVLEERFAEASLLKTIAIAGIASAGAGIVFFALKGNGGDSSQGRRQRVSDIELADFAVLYRSRAAATFAYRGTSSEWSGTTLRIRLDDYQATCIDFAASRFLGSQFLPPMDLLNLDAGPSNGLLTKLEASSSHESAHSRSTGLRIHNARAPQELVDGPALTVELRPGFGLLSLYGQPSSFRLQEDSLMRKTQLAEGGTYSAKDFFSSRPDRVSRALVALAEHPADRFRVRVNDEQLLPCDGNANESVLSAALQALGFSGTADLVEVVGMLLLGDGATLLSNLLRAQCAAGGGIPQKARELDDILRRHFPGGLGLDANLLEASLERGFWNLSPDETGMSQRDREADRLLERARRELWSDGSASRHELELQIRIFLCRYLLGCAASRAGLRIQLIRQSPELTQSERLRELRYAPLTTIKGLWYRLEMDPLEVPLTRELQEGLAPER